MAATMTSGAWLCPVLAAVMPRPAGVREYVSHARQANPRLGKDELASQLADRICWLYATQGSAPDLPGLVAAPGTAASLAVEAGYVNADAAMLLRNAAYLSQAVASAHGHEPGDMARLTDLLVVLGLWAGVVKPGLEALPPTPGDAAARIGKQFVIFDLDRVPEDAGAALIDAVAGALMDRLGAWRGARATGMLAPFGMGAVAGGGFNLAMLKEFKKAVHAWYGQLKPGNVPLTVEGE